MKLCYELFLFIICVQVMSPARNIIQIFALKMCESVLVYVLIQLCPTKQLLMSRQENQEGNLILI